MRITPAFLHNILYTVNPPIQSGSKSTMHDSKLHIVTYLKTVNELPLSDSFKVSHKHN